jgi:hypothetical protein
MNDITQQYTKLPPGHRRPELDDEDFLEEMSEAELTSAVRDRMSRIFNEERAITSKMRVRGKR